MNIQKVIKSILYVHVSRTWDGKNKETTKSHDANIILFNIIRIQPQWRSFDNDSVNINLYLGFIREYYHTRLLNIQIYPTFEFSAPLFRRFWKRTINYFKIKKLEQEIQELMEVCENICSDPMCACPEDFAFDYSRRINVLEYKINDLTY